MRIRLELFADAGSDDCRLHLGIPLASSMWISDRCWFMPAMISGSRLSSFVSGIFSNSWLLGNM